MVRFNLVIVSLSIIFCGCATIYNPATERYEYIFISTDTEVAIGRSVQQELLKKKSLSLDLIANERVKKIGRTLAVVSDRKDIEYNFYILDDDELNALALPGGFIYVNKGLVNILDDNELAYVLGHEIGHLACRHIVKKMQANMAYELILNIAFMGMGKTLEETAIENALKGINTVFDFISLGYSRKDEYEADRVGVRYAYQAGFNPYSAISALEKIRQTEGPNWKILGYFRSHPYADERIWALNKYIPELTSIRDRH